MTKLGFVMAHHATSALSACMGTDSRSCPPCRLRAVAVQRVLSGEVMPRDVLALSQDAMAAVQSAARALWR